MAPRQFYRGNKNIHGQSRIAAGLAPVSRAASRVVLWLLFGGATAEIIFHEAMSERWDLTGATPR